MEVLLKTGRYNGEIRDVRPDIASEMIADGRAIDARFAQAPPVAEVRLPSTTGDSSAKAASRRARRGLLR